MMKSLYFICPCDSLECIINDTFKGENYFYCSLGNSVTFDDESILGQIKYLIQAEAINDITFVLSIGNRILLDAVGSQSYSEVSGLSYFYAGILNEKKITEAFWRTREGQHLILSCHLDSKVKELALAFNSMFHCELKISARIYDRELDQFYSIYSN